MTSLSSSLFYPVILAGLLYCVVAGVGRLREGRDDGSSERLLDLAFGLLLVTAGYLVVLAVLATAQFPSRMLDLVSILAIFTLFFGALVAALLGVVDLGLAHIGRRRRRRGAAARRQADDS